jgi:multidrug resistance efflux pump
VVANDATALAAQKIQTLERDIAAALARSARLEASLTDMNTRLQQAESQRWPSELLYGLVVLVLACLLSVGWLWNRLRRLQAERGGLWRHSVMNQTNPAADLDQPRASSFAVAAAVSSQASPLTESVQSFELQREPFYPGTDPSQDRAAPLTEPTLAAAELSLDLDNLIDFDSSQGKKPPVS